MNRELSKCDARCCTNYGLRERHPASQTTSSNLKYSYFQSHIEFRTRFYGKTNQLFIDDLEYHGNSLNSSPDRSTCEDKPLNDVPVKKKRYAPKVKTGCLTCKRRRVKCDESKPDCNRCINIGRQCEYPTGQSSETNFNARTFPFARWNRMRNGGVSKDLMPFYGTCEEQQYLDTFLHLTAPWMSNYCHSYVFTELLPQSSWQHPALKHALVAVAMASETALVSSAKNRGGRQDWHYYRAIRYLSSDSSAGEEIILLTSILFWIYDNIKNRSDSALTHLIGALKIVNEGRCRRETRGANDIVSLQIEPTLRVGLIFSAAAAGPEFVGPPDPEVTKAIRRCIADSSYTHRFDTMEDVRDQLALTVISFVHAVKRHVPDHNGYTDTSNLTFSEIRMFLERWYRAFSRVVKGVNEIDRKLLECHYICIALATDYYEFKGDPNYMADPQIVARCNYVLDQVEAFGPEVIAQTPEVRDLNLPIIPLLSSCARFCSNSLVKQRALQMMKKLNRVEGLWHSAVAAELLQKISKEKLKLT